MVPIPTITSCCHYFSFLSRLDSPISFRGWRYPCRVIAFRCIWHVDVLHEMASWGIVLSTSTELERVYIENIKKQLGHHRVSAVGTVLPRDNGASANRGESSSAPCHELMAWLDARKGGSGCLCILRESWCADDEADGSTCYLKGWTRQLEILRHRTVGAFLTHCGWNSEGPAAGVLTLMWPIGAEQFLNVRLLVEQLGIGIWVGKGSRNIPELADEIRLLVESMDESRQERLKAKELKDKVLSSVAKGGSSDGDSDEFINNLNQFTTLKGR